MGGTSWETEAAPSSFTLPHFCNLSGLRVAAHPVLYRLDFTVRPGLCRSVPIVGGQESILPFRCLAKFDHLLDVFVFCL